MARRPLRDDAAVSPVIGVILMIAITVVLGALVMLIAGGMRQPPQGGVQLQFRLDQAGSQLTIISIQSVTDLSHIEVQLAVDGHAAFNGPAGLASTPAPAGQFVKLATVPGTVLAAGDTFRFCSDLGLSDGATVRIRSIHPSSLFYENTFSYLPACA